MLLAADPDQQRRATRALLGDRRFQVGEDAERAFRVEGLLRLSLNVRTAQTPQESRRFTRMVAGARYDTDEPTIELRWVA